MKHLIPLSAVIKENLRRHWIKFALIAFSLFLVSQKDLSIDLQLNSILEPQAFSESVIQTSQEAIAVKAVNTSLLNSPKKTEKKPVNYENKSNKSVKSQNTSKVKKVSAGSTAKRKRQDAYVKRYAKLAKDEMKKYGIPASITLAQGLLESGEGTSRLAKNNNNHFGIKCFSRSCRKGHCSNFTDDSHKDFFRIYNNSWESYRAHSILLQKDRYKKLYKFNKRDYKSWARGLKSAGYATDKRYAEKLIRIIEEHDLDKYDR